MNFNIGEILGKAWKITWKYKVLWIFGILASCGTGSSNGGGNNSNQMNNNFRPGDNPFSSQMMRQLINPMEHLGQWVSQHTWVIFAFFAFMVLVFILQVFFIVIGKVGVVRGALHAENEIPNLHFGKLFRESLDYFWRMIGLWLIVWLPFLLVFFSLFFGFIFGIGLVTSDTNPFAMGVAFISAIFGLLCIYLLVIILLSLYYRQAVLALLIDQVGILDSLKRAWQVLRHHFGELLIMGLILFGIGLVGGVLISLPVIVIVTSIMSAFLEGGIRSWTPFIVAGALLLAYSPISLFLNGVLRAYSESAWTLTYIRLTAKPQENAPVLVEGNAQ